MRFTVKLEGLKEAMEMLDPAKVQRAAMRAINRAAASAKTEASKVIRSEYTLAKSEVDKRMDVREATTNDLTGALVVTGERLGLALYGARETKRGVSVAVKRGDRKLLRGAFLAPWKKRALDDNRGQSGEWVFFRQKLAGAHQRKYAGKVRTVTRVPRTPREVLLGPSVPQVFKQPRVIDVIKERTGHYLRERFAHELQYEMRRGRR